MWTAKNKVTGREYNFIDAQKAHYEGSPHLSDKYTFKRSATTQTQGVEKVEEKPKKEKTEPQG